MIPLDLTIAIHAAAQQTANLLRRDGRRVVFAESCTAGLVSGSLAQIPGISEHLCGSAVVYRAGTKQQWLSVTAEDLDRYSAVSAPVTRAMSMGALQITPEADISVAVTGHLGPDAPAELDGQVFIAVAARRGGAAAPTMVGEHQLRLGRLGRVERQFEAVLSVLAHLNTTM